MVVYKITNLVNGKIYVGQTKQSIEKRFLQYSYANSLLGQAIRKFGVENFTIEIIEECENQQQLNEREIFLIAKLNCKVPNSYNVADGGRVFKRTFFKRVVKSATRDFSNATLPVQIKTIIQYRNLTKLSKKSPTSTSGGMNLTSKIHYNKIQTLHKVSLVRHGTQYRRWDGNSRLWRLCKTQYLYCATADEAGSSDFF